MDTPHDGPHRQEPDQPRRPAADAVLIEGRFRSIEDKARWMLAGRERRDSNEPAEPDALLAELSDRDISGYVATSVRDRPWLSVLTADHPPGIWRAVVALDKGESHTLERHSAYGDSTTHERRVTHLEDPAQTDPKLRAHRIDGISGKAHYCGIMQTRFTDVNSLVTAYANSKKDPRVAAALETPYSLGAFPDEVERRAWEKDRDQWIAEHGSLSEFPSQPPPAERIATFEGGTIIFRFGHNTAHDGYAIRTFYPEPNKGNA